MSKALELAKRSRRISEILMSNGTVNTLRVIKYCIESETELRRLAQVEAEHAALKEELEADREETKRWRNAAKWEQEIRKQAEMIADKAVTEHAALLKAISDAEPDHFRAVLADDQKPRQIKTSMHVVGIREKQAADAFIEEQQTFYGWNYTLEPLYTLNGIKKP